MHAAKFYSNTLSIKLITSLTSKLHNNKQESMLLMFYIVFTMPWSYKLPETNLIGTDRSLKKLNKKL